MLDIEIRKTIITNRDNWEKEVEELLAELVKQMKETPDPVVDILDAPFKRPKYNVSPQFKDGLIMVACSYIVHKLTLSVLDAEDLEEQWGEDE